MKRLQITDTSAASLAIPATVIRVFFGTYIDSPDLFNSGWIAALGGGLLTLPLIVVLCKMRSRSDQGALIDRVSSPLLRIIAILFAASLTFDAALAVVCIGISASYIAIDNITTFYLLLPQFVLCFWCLTFNGNSIGSAAKVWIRILAAIIAIISIFILPKYRPAWLTPILGPGMSSLFMGSLRCASWYSIMIPLFLLSEKSDQAGASDALPIKSLALSTGISSLLLLLCGMLSPSQLHSSSVTRFSRLDTLISNGRLALGLQMPMIVIWFVGFFFLLLCESWISAAMIQKLVPKFRNNVCIVIAVAAIILLSFSSFCDRDGSRLSAIFLYPAYSIVIILCICSVFRNKGAHNHV